MPPSVPEQPEPLRQALGDSGLRRMGPFAVVTVVAFVFAFVSVHGNGIRREEIVASLAVVCAAVAFLLFGRGSGAPRALQPIAPILYYAAVVLLRDATGGGTSQYTAMVALPVVWIALFESRRMLYVAYVLLAVTMFAPSMFSPGRYPWHDLSRDIVWILVAATIGSTIKRLVDLAWDYHQRAAREAAARAAEYARARRDYTQIVRHRVMNPLTVIGGAAETLRSINDLEAPIRGQLLESILAACAELEQIVLEPERRGVEEADLDAIPHDPSAS